MAAPNAVFFARIHCLTRLYDVYDAQITIRNGAHYDIRRIRVPLHAELRRGKAERRGLGVAGKPATFKQASEGSGKRVTINFCAACGTKLCLDSAQNGTSSLAVSVRFASTQCSTTERQWHRPSLRSTMRFAKMVTNHGNWSGHALGVNPLRMKTKPMSLLGQSRPSDWATTTSGLPRQADNLRAGRHFAKCQRATYRQEKSFRECKLVHIRQRRDRGIP